MHTHQFKWGDGRHGRIWGDECSTGNITMIGTKDFPHFLIRVMITIIIKSMQDG
jgi:hypothetical protein